MGSEQIENAGSAGSAAKCHGMHHRCIGNCGCRGMLLSAPEGNERRETSLITAGRVEGLRETEKTCGNHEEQENHENVKTS